MIILKVLERRKKGGILSPLLFFTLVAVPDADTDGTDAVNAVDCSVNRI